VSDQANSPRETGAPWGVSSATAAPNHVPPPPPGSGRPGGFLGQSSDLVTPPPPPPTQYVSASSPTSRRWPYATWIVRVAASLIDSLVVMIGAIPYAIGLVLMTSAAGNAPDPYTVESTGGAGLAVIGLMLTFAGLLLMLGIWLWNRVFTQGRTGQSVGKRVMRLYLVSESTGNPMGAGLCFVREIAHYLDGILMLGYLWPIWDAKRQTFADKVMSTVVAQAPSATV
jgi:uncharacterized RDD family membrane protein YckC